MSRGHYRLFALVVTPEKQRLQAIWIVRTIHFFRSAAQGSGCVKPRLSCRPVFLAARASPSPQAAVDPDHSLR